MVETPLPSDIPAAWVVGWYGYAVPDSALDADALPGTNPATGTVTFTPYTTRVISTAGGSPVKVIVPTKTTSSLINGFVTDAEKRESVSLVAGIRYKVSVALTGATTQTFDITPTAANTQQNPMDLGLQMELVPEPGTKFVVNEQVYTDTLAAAARAVAAADRAEQVGGGGGTSGVSTVNGRSGVVVLNKGDVGLANADNTADADKPISTAAQAAINGKAPIAHTHVASQITDSSTIGRSVLMAADAAAARSALAVAAASTTLTAGTGLTGGGDQTASRTIALSAASIASLAKADTAVQPAALATKADLVNGVIPTSQIPAIALGETFVVGSQAAMLALTAQNGDVAKRSDQNGAAYLLTGGDPSVLANWLSIGAAGGAVNSVNGQTGTVTLGKADVGLGNVSNLAPADLPLSTAATSALSGKAPTTHTHTASQISDSSTVGRSVVTAADAGTARTAIGAAGTATTLTAGTGLTGGGDFSANRTVALSSASIASLAKADGAVASDGAILRVLKITSAAYSALATKDANTLYVQVG